ncbi:putative transposase-like protein, partial [Dinothrombium tinctorium]
MNLPPCSHKQRSKRNPEECRFIILKDIFKWESENLMVQKAIDWDILPKEGEKKCNNLNCNGYLFLREDADSLDGKKWFCRGKVHEKKKKPKNCKVTQRLRTNSFFAKSHLELWQIYSFVNLWLRKVPLLTIAEQTLMTPKTAVDWSSFCREKVGGPGKIVEIDEVKFGKRKYHRGKYVEGSWVFGGIERDSGRIFMEVVPNRSKDVLIPLIEQWIKKGTIIYSDQFSSYRQLNLHGYTHLTVNHQENFRDPETGACTNKIECSWGHAKQSVPQRGRKKEFLGGYLARFLFIKRSKVLKTDPMLFF